MLSNTTRSCIANSETPHHLQAPTKQLIMFDQSGHRALFQEPTRFHDVMTGTVLAQTYPQ